MKYTHYDVFCCRYTVLLIGKLLLYVHIQAGMSTSSRTRKVVQTLLLLACFRATVSFQPNLQHQRHRPQSGISFSSLSGASGSGQGGDPVLRLPLMEAELATLPPDADKTKLISEISDAKTAAEFGVRRAQLEFYDAFSNGDLDAMDKVWSKESHVRCVHPGMSSIEGREKVMESWKQILQGEGLEIQPDRAQVEIHGLVAICSCVEVSGGASSLEAINIYKREGSRWCMTCHMAGPVVMRPDGGAFF